jgi:hypothetical protein
MPMRMKVDGCAWVLLYADITMVTSFSFLFMDVSCVANKTVYKF